MNLSLFGLDFPFLIRFLAIIPGVLVFWYLVKNRPQFNQKTHSAYRALQIMLMSSLLIRFLNLSRRVLILIGVDYQFITFFLYLGWMLYVIRYQALFTLTETLTSNRPLFKKIWALMCGLIIVGLIYIMLFYYRLVPPIAHTQMIYPIIRWYAFSTIFFSLIRLGLYKRRCNIPKILNNQLFIILLCIMIPSFCFTLTRILPFSFLHDIVNDKGLFGNILSLINSFAIYYAIKKLIQLRLLNMKDHVQDDRPFTFLDDFRAVLERMGEVKQIRELIHISRQFFKDTFGIPLTHTMVYFRDVGLSIPKDPKELTDVETITEEYKQTYRGNQKVLQPIKKNKILIAEEISFDQFYSPCKNNEIYLEFLKKIDADIFLPIYRNGKGLLAYIVVSKSARTKLYSTTDRDQMVLFAHYIGKVLAMMESYKINDLIAEKNLAQIQKKNLEHELFTKHKEHEMFYESMQTLMGEQDEQKDGVIFYKNGSFMMGNDEASEMLQTDLNRELGTQITKTLKTFAQKIENFKSISSCQLISEDGRKINVNGFYNFHFNCAQLSLTYASSIDQLSTQLKNLKDPSAYDYLFYLQTTHAGKLINQLIPGKSKTFLQLKIELLKAVIGNRAVLLDVAQDDWQGMAQLIHSLGQRKEFHRLTIKTLEDNEEVALRLFGLDPVYDKDHSDQDHKGVLEKLDGGTLLIENIERASIQTQKMLAAYLDRGIFIPCRSTKESKSDVRILFATHHDLAVLAKEGKIIESLYKHLQQSTIALASLHNLSSLELNELTAQIYLHVTGKKIAFKDKQEIVSKKPFSITALKIAVQNLIAQQKQTTPTNALSQTTQIDNRYDSSNPELVAAARLGKHALKDPKIMGMLWTQLSKSQASIAQILGVNRSSVNRRCKEYGLE